MMQQLSGGEDIRCELESPPDKPRYAGLYCQRRTFRPACGSPSTMSAMTNGGACKFVMRNAASFTPASMTTSLAPGERSERRVASMRTNPSARFTTLISPTSTKACAGRRTGRGGIRASHTRHASRRPVTRGDSGGGVEVCPFSGRPAQAARKRQSPRKRHLIPQKAIPVAERETRFELAGFVLMATTLDQPMAAWQKHPLPHWRKNPRPGRLCESGGMSRHERIAAARRRFHRDRRR